MTKFEISLLKTEITRYKFTLTAKDEKSAENLVNILINELENGKDFPLGLDVEDELEDCQWEMEELSEE